MKSALECNPHSNVIRNFWEKKKKKSADCFRVNTVFIFLHILSTHICRAWRLKLSILFLYFLTILLLLFKVYEDECREFEKRHCQMEQRPQKKQIKKYVYNIRCEPRTLRPCHTFNVAKMSTHCEPEFYDKCQVVPHEKCQEVPKEACFKEPVMVKRTKCSSGPTSSDFSSTTSKLSENSFTADQY